YQALPVSSVAKGRLTAAVCAAAPAVPTARASASARTTLIVCSPCSHERRGPGRASLASESRHHFVQEARELAALVPGGQAQCHVAEPGIRVRAQLRRAGLRVAGDRRL